ncbi:DUF2993 domain-containing protein [Synechococcus sp. RSCCF101]|uniref:LmeA family phospholipid-binding protein n=1 Tax=Synechococcus sp. RSCCF101 TaxID=2511069 RepID=UPI0012482393|nr:DUF2993 domain-containing protein [Synechococcus sp. RSCCF101]QEY31138.1 DUF2993 domain-containing protein [Synechococcus sp. RSCCF101]
MSADTGRSGPDGGGDGPWISLIARALRLWVRAQCDRSGALDLQLHGSALSLLRGRLDGVDLTARDVIFKGLHLGRVQLHGDAIQARIQRSGTSPLQLRDPFRIQGEVALPVAALTASLQQPSWQWLQEWLGQALLQRPGLEGLEADGDAMVLTGRGEAAGDGAAPRIRVRPSAEAGRLVLTEEGGPAVARFPADPGLTIRGARIENGQLLLQGEARVTP